MTDGLFTSFGRVLNAVQEYSGEPFERILVHGIDVGQVTDAEEKYLRVDRHRHVLATCEIDVFFGLLCNHHFGLFEGEEELFKKMKIDESYYIQYIETFKLSKSFVKDVLNFFITKRDFFNCNIYESLEMIKSSERYKSNNVKSCFIK